MWKLEGESMKSLVSMSEFGARKDESVWEGELFELVKTFKVGIYYKQSSVKLGSGVGWRKCQLRTLSSSQVTKRWFAFHKYNSNKCHPCSLYNCLQYPNLNLWCPAICCFTTISNVYRGWPRTKKCFSVFSYQSSRLFPARILLFSFSRVSQHSILLSVSQPLFPVL